MGIVIVGLGPGDGRYVTREAWDVLAGSGVVYVRTALHPAVADLPCEVISFDGMYEDSADFQATYQQIIAQILTLGRTNDVVYAVPGHPHVGEFTVLEIERLAAAETIPVRIIAGLSFIEPTLSTLKIDALDGLQIFDAITLIDHNRPPINPDSPLLLGQLYSSMLASELKQLLLSVYAADDVVHLVHGAGTDEAVVETVALYDIDRSTQIHNLTSLYLPPRANIGSLAHFADTIALLRSPNGCPWDREQTPQTLRADFLEEFAEVLDALDRDDPIDLCDELGDLLLHIVMQAQIAFESGDFSITDVIAGIDAKIKRRHPHVWGDLVLENTKDLNQTWDAIKAQEKAGKNEPAQPVSLLDNIPPALSALARSQKIQKKVGKAGFDWPSIDGVWEKLAEEIGELKAAEGEEISAELGDILFITVNLAKWLGVDAETALRETNLRFMRRFAVVEQLMAERKVSFKAELAIIEGLWQEAKERVG